jgi:hypothetical protein
VKGFTTSAAALAFVREHGVVLVSAKGAAPRLTEAIAGEPIKGSWWGHPLGHHIFAILGEVTDSNEVLVCRLLDGKVTLVHRRLWPALVRLAGSFAPQQIAQVREEHSATGRHLTRELAFPKWVPPEIRQQAMTLSEDEARSALAPWTQAAGKTPSRKRSL